MDSSDLDLALEGDSRLGRKTMGALEDAFEDSSLPYTVDVVDLNRISDSFRRIVAAQMVPFPVAQDSGETRTNRRKVHTSDDAAATIEERPIRNGASSRETKAPSEWRVVNLGAYVVINDRSYSTKEAWPFINYLDTGNISENHISKIQKIDVSKYKIPSRARRKVQSGDIVYSTVRPNQKHFGLLKKIPENFLVSTGFAVLRGKDNLADTDFLYWFLAQDHIVEYLHSIAENSTSTYPAIRPSDLEGISLSLPPLPEQRAIAHVLGTLDGKIELNRRMNVTLEEMARALFKSWFVDFEPVRAKMDDRWNFGESLSGLPIHLYDLFPDKLVDSELGKIPQGWKTKPLSDCIHVARGLSYKGSGLSPNGIPLHNLNSIYRGGGYKDGGIKYYNGDFQDRHLTQPGDVIVANTDLVHDRRLIGYAAIVPKRFGSKGLFSHHIYRIRPNASCTLSSYFIYHILNEQILHDVISGYATGTTVDMLPMDALRIPKIVLPSSEAMTQFNRIIAANHSRQEELIVESCILAAQRAVLLPKLISGELRTFQLNYKWGISK